MPPPALIVLRLLLQDKHAFPFLSHWYYLWKWSVYLTEMQVLFLATVKIACMVSVPVFGIVVFDMLTNCPRYQSYVLWEHGLRSWWQLWFCFSLPCQRILVGLPASTLIVTCRKGKKALLDCEDFFHYVNSELVCVASQIIVSCW